MAILIQRHDEKNEGVWNISRLVAIIAAMRIETERLYLRPFTLDDKDHIWDLHSNTEVMKYTRMGRALSRDESLKTLEKNVKDGIWAAFDLRDDSFVGWFMLRMTSEDCPELGFMIVQQKWGQGLTTEAAKALMNFKKEPKLCAFTAFENMASQRVLEKLGFQHVGAIEDSKHFVKVEAN